MSQTLLCVGADMAKIEGVYFGFDFGRVVTEFLLGRTAEQAEKNFLDVKPYPFAFEAIATIVEATSGRTFCVSYCKSKVESMTRRWLTHHKFYDVTGFRPEMLAFTQDYTQKADEALSITNGKATHFVDDKLVILDPMRGRLPNLQLFGEQPENQVVPAGIERVANWPAVVERLGLTL